MKGGDVGDHDAVISCPVLEFDAETQKFVGNSAADANKLLRRDYRSKFEVPAIA